MRSVVTLGLAEPFFCYGKVFSCTYRSKYRGTEGTDELLLHPLIRRVNHLQAVALCKVDLLLPPHSR